MSSPGVSMQVPCPECRRSGQAHQVQCWVERRLLDELEVEDVTDIRLDVLYHHFDHNDGVHIDQVCGECGSDYTRDEDGNIID